MQTQEFWENWYSNGGISGIGSIGKEREWKWNIISSFVDISNSDVIDVGCGDLSFWEEHSPRTYTGIDFSSSIMKDNIRKCPQWSFINGSASYRYDIKSDVVFCLDVLFHVLDKQIFDKILDNLSYYSKKWIFIYTWTTNPFLSRKFQLAQRLMTVGKFSKIPNALLGTETDFIHQKFWSLDNYKIKDFELISKEKYPNDNYGSMLIYRRI